jgi:hypothetical protein
VVKEAAAREPYSPEDHLRNAADNAYAKGEPRAILDALRQARAQALEEAAEVVMRLGQRKPLYHDVGAHEAAAAIRALKGPGE